MCVTSLDLQVLADQLQARNARRTVGRLVRAAARGRPLESEAALRLVVEALRERWPDLTPEDFVGLLRPSLSRMAVSERLLLDLVGAE